MNKRLSKLNALNELFDNNDFSIRNSTVPIYGVYIMHDEYDEPFTFGNTMKYIDENSLNIPKRFKKINYEKKQRRV